MWTALFTQEWPEPSDADAEEQPASTCGQCGKVFNRKYNMLKHLQHCTGHRPPSPQQQKQKQHTTAAPPTFTISHRYTSIGGAAKRYNIDMQGTQYLDHLSPTLHLLPTMQNFQVEHHNYKSLAQGTTASSGPYWLACTLY